MGYEKLLQKQKLNTVTFTIRRMKEIIIEILKRWADDDINLQSEAAREVLAKELTYELLKELGKEL